ncbi:hypothetical protein [Streptomyces sp. NPDC056227]|uniref:hypothetical protein n=1 Tax=Streptomyces sp. NPDC056227 TaxID=3345753 RepID=UPI0035DED878
MEVICHGRRSTYAEAARAAAPQAVQVADAWHLWNTSDSSCAEDRARTLQMPSVRVRRYGPASSEAEPPLAPDGTKDVNGCPRRIVAGIRERRQAANELLSHGCPLRGISRDLQLDYHTVRRHARTPDVDDLLVKVTSRRTLLDDLLQAVHLQAVR